MNVVYYKLTTRTKTKKPKKKTLFDKRQFDKRNVCGKALSSQFTLSVNDKTYATVQFKAPKK